jgi:hypothetical protein
MIDYTQMHKDLIVYEDEEYPPNTLGRYVFENQQGIMLNGNRRIHTANWSLKDLKAIVKFLERVIK